MSKIVASWKSFTGRKISAYRKECMSGTAGPAPVWQREYFDRFIRDAGHYANAISYIHMNPVQARLVKNPEEWEFSSACPPLAWREGQEGSVADIVGQHS